jgi:hypothetical protein
MGQSRLFAGHAIDAFRQQVGLANMPRILLDHVVEQGAQGDRSDLGIGEAVVQAGTSDRGAGHVPFGDQGGDVFLGIGGGGVGPCCVGTVSSRVGVFGPRSPAHSIRKWPRSASVRCRTNPSSDRLDGGTA